MRSRWLVSGIAIVFLMLVSLNSIAHPLKGVSVRVTKHHSRDEQNQSRDSLKIITHLTLLDFKHSTSAQAESDALYQMVQLKDKCIHPITTQPYIKSIRGGKNVSPQDLNAGTTHAFVIEFRSVEHRDFWVNHDPVRKEFVDRLNPLLERLPIVVDFEDGYFF
ncbi:Fc.00g021280.m01.CDS01 [Cosmosporella sp. VM-42]